jgi:hypothetical protein
MPGIFILCCMNKAALVVPFIVIALLSAIWSGWTRMGFDLPVSSAAVHHGSLMVNGFLASLIYLERCVTFKNKLVLLLPLLNALSVILHSYGIPYSNYIHTGCRIAFMVMCAWFIYQYKELYYYVFFAGAFCLVAGNIVLYETSMYPAAVIWWIEFLLFTIVAERLELTKFLPLSNGIKGLLIVLLLMVFISGLLPFHGYGSIAFAATLAGTAVWLLKYDMAFRSIKAKGPHRFSGALLITGYAWLIITAVLFCFWKDMNFGYDALLHSFFIGFVFSMIFSHAPIILPAIMKKSVKIYRPFLYMVFVLLQVSLIARIIADMGELITVRKYAGLMNGMIILLFFVSIGMIVYTELNRKKRLIKA